MIKAVALILPSVPLDLYGLCELAPCLAPEAILHALLTGRLLKPRYNRRKKALVVSLNSQSRDESRFILRAKRMVQTAAAMPIVTVCIWRRAADQLRFDFPL